MALEASGILWMHSTTNGNSRSIYYEVYGETASGVSYFTDIVGDSDPIVSASLPHYFSDFYSHTQTTYGRCYGEDDHVLYNFWLYDGSSYIAVSTTGTETIEFIGSGSAQSVSGHKTSSGGNFLLTDNVAMQVYRRTKNTSNVWGVYVQVWNPYVSQSYTCDFTTYDYKFRLLAGK